MSDTVYLWKLCIDELYRHDNPLVGPMNREEEEEAWRMLSQEDHMEVQEILIGVGPHLVFRHKEPVYDAPTEIA